MLIGQKGAKKTLESISRRNLLRGLGASAAAGAAIPSLRAFRPFEELVEEPAASPDRIIRLDRNENAYGPSEKTMAVMREEARFANRYPDAQPKLLTSRIAEVHGVTPEQVVVGCGSSEIVRAMVSTFLGPGKKLIMASPSWGLVAEFARKRGAEVVPVPLNRQFAHDLGAMLTRVDASTGMIYVCNPNNPTGSLTPRKNLEDFIHRLPSSTYVAIDEAYHQYSARSPASASFIDQPIQDSRVVVTRTFSTIYGLAGLRVGYAIAAPATARLLAAASLPFGVNLIAVRAAAAALEDTEHLGSCVQKNTDDRQEFLNQVNARMLRALDSQTNFVMLNTGRPAEEVIQHFSRNNVILPAPFSPLKTYVRVSLGTPQDMAEFWRVWDLLPTHHMST